MADSPAQGSQPVTSNQDFTHKPHYFLAESSMIGFCDQ